MQSFLWQLHDWVLSNNPKAIAEDINKAYPTLLREINPDDPGAKLGVNDFRLITKLTGDFEALDFLERSLHRVAFRLPDKHPEIKNLHTHVAESLKEFGNFIKAVGDSMLDGKITKQEIAKCKKKSYDLIQIVALLVQSLENMERPSQV